MNRILNILKDKRLYKWGAGLALAGIILLLLMDKWIMPAYTNYNEGVTVPDVTKISLQEAESILETYGLRYEILDRRAHNAYPADYIIDQTPYPRQIVKPNRKIYLTVNTAIRPTTVVPNVVDLSLRNARIQIENYGLNVGTISNESGRFRNTILRQSVAAGDTVNTETVIDLVVSDGLGNMMVTVPQIVGLSLPEAQQRIEEAGLRVGPIQFQPSSEAVPNTILSRIPEGVQLREGETLILVVSVRHDASEEDESGIIMSDPESSSETMDEINEDN